MKEEVFLQQPMTCVRSGAKGCDVASLNNADATKDNCEIIDGLMPENCKLTIKCKEGKNSRELYLEVIMLMVDECFLSGYIPSDPTAVDGNGEQSLVCVAKNDGWKDSKTGKTKVAPVKCVPVCTLVSDYLVFSPFSYSSSERSSREGRIRKESSRFRCGHF